MKTTPELVQAARKRGCPVLAIATYDPAQTMREVADSCPSACEKWGKPIALVSWDYATGFRHLTTASKPVLESVLVGGGDDSVQNPIAGLEKLRLFPSATIVFWHMGDRYMRDDNPFSLAFLQGVWNLRDAYKQNNRVLVLLGRSFQIPPELSNDVVLLHEPLPTKEQTKAIISKVVTESGLKLEDDILERAAEASQGQSAFSIEQNAAMCLHKEGIHLDDLWERKRVQIEQTPGLTVYRGAEKFADIGGIASAKEFATRLINGKKRPNSIVWIDEIDKMLDGQDLSGTSQHQLGSMLTYMQENHVLGMLFVGPPGTSKSLLAKAMGNECGVPTMCLNLGDVKGSLVGESERKMGDALRVITAVSNGQPYIIATANSIANLNTALLRRFRYVFYFDLPDAAEKASIWSIHLKARGLEDADLPNDNLWAGADIQACCEAAWMLDISLKTAAQSYIVPVGVRSAREISTLRDQAHHNLLSASYPGVYRKPAINGERSVSL